MRQKVQAGRDIMWDQEMKSQLNTEEGQVKKISPGLTVQLCDHVSVCLSVQAIFLVDYLQLEM